MARSTDACLPALLLLLAVAASAVEDQTRVDPTTSNTIPLGAIGVSTMISAAATYPRIAGPATGRLTFYASMKWDGHLAGQNKFWMGLADGGCQYGNLLNQNKYPYLAGASLGPGLLRDLGIPSASVGCGACVRVTCPSGTAYCKPGNPSVVVTLLDICPGGICSDNQIDMYQSAWDVLAQDSNPEGVTVERVQCPTPNANVHLYVTELSATYLKVNFQNIGGSGLLTQVEVSHDGGASYAPMANQYGAAWVQDTGLQGASHTFRLTTDDGASLVTETFAGLKQGRWNDKIGGDWADVRDCGVQFGGGGGLGGAAPTGAALSDVSPNQFTCFENATWGKCADPTWVNGASCPPEGCCAASCAAQQSQGRKLLR